jgi:hypothetical protein
MSVKRKLLQMRSWFLAFNTSCLIPRFLSKLEIYSLVSTATVPKISNLLKKRGIRHDVLNAKNHEREAEIVANAGQKGAVTINRNST